MTRREKTKIKSNTKTVTITDKNTNGNDEAYGEWFTCPKCNQDLIANEFSYCPGCGRKIKWKTTK